MLRGLGFRGFRSVSHLERTKCLELPVERGVYVVIRDSDEPPVFLACSVAGWFRRQDPSAAVDVLEGKWVAGARVLYFGRAGGPGVRARLQQRVKRYLRFGQGKAVGSAGGRFVWQLLDHQALQIAWLPTPDQDPAMVESGLLDGFHRRYGRLPFANLGTEAAQ